MSSSLRLRIIVTDPPPDTYNGQPALFGLQDKKGALQPGLPGDAALIFTCELHTDANDPPTFTGAVAHGTPRDRFLYLSYRLVDAPAWIRRIKVPLSSITAAQVAAGCVLETVVDGRRSARVNVEWKAV